MTRLAIVRTSLLLLLVAMFLVAGPTLAANDGYLFELTPFVAYKVGGEFEDRDTNEEFKLDESSAYGLVFGIPWNADTNFEVYYSHQSTELDLSGFQSSGNPIDVDLDFLQLGGTYFFDRRGPALPFFSATAGGTRIKPSGSGAKSETFLSFGVGGGWKFFPDKRVGLRLEGRALGTFIDSNSRIFCGVNNGSGTCLINTSGRILWQFEAQAGIVFRF